MNANDPDTARDWRQIEKSLDKTSGSSKVKDSLLRSTGLRKYGIMYVY